MLRTEEVSKNPNVLVVLLNYRTYEDTLRVVQELKNLKYDNYDVMVVDNCSPNESKTVLSDEADKYGYIFYASQYNGGYAVGNNIGIRYASEHNYQYTWILSNDVKLCDENILQQMVGIAERDEKIACVGPKVISPEGVILAPYCNRPTALTLTLKMGAERKKRASQCEVSQKVYRVHGCCALLKNSAMKIIDGMDERTFLYYEDVILGERLFAAGFDSYYDAETSIIHIDGGTIKRVPFSTKINYVLVHAKSQNLYLKEYRHFSVLLRMIMIFFGAIIYLVRL